MDIHVREQSTDRLRPYKQEMEKYCNELWGILLFRRCVLRSPNSHGENTAKPTKKRQANSDHQTLWLGPFEQQRFKR